MTGFDVPVTSFLSYLYSLGSRIRVQDLARLASKLRSIRSDGIYKFQVISDFDRTLTPQWLKDPCAVTGKRRQCHASHGVVESSPFVSESYRRVTREYANHYIPIEHDHSLSVAERKSAVEEWYTKAHEAMLGEDISFSKLEEMVCYCWKTFDIHLRDNAFKFFEVSRVHGVPVTVLSAGIRDVIEMLLVHEKVLPCVSSCDDLETEDHPVMVVSNRMKFDPSTRMLVGFVDPLITALTKKTALHDFLIASSERSIRPNALVMGDLIADVDFVHSIPHLGEYIAIGYLGDPTDHVTQDTEERIQDYLQHYDIVILGGSSSLEVPTRLVECIVASDAVD